MNQRKKVTIGKSGELQQTNKIFEDINMCHYNKFKKCVNCPLKYFVNAYIF